MGFIKRFQPIKNMMICIQMLALIDVINEKIFEIYPCSGPSMLPTLNAHGDLLGVDKWHGKNGRGCRAGDIIVAIKPGTTNIRIAKRIIGMPGDVICKDPLMSRAEFIKVPEGHVWVMGDNLLHSLDSRNYGPLPMALIKGKVVCRVLPDFKWFKNELSPLSTTFS
ncbi:unnamed protein product [Pneumocystis jirovecii]|uniref:Peptidase S26 domain-containing protein n=2 Tax=Pneumocystis jirovecii TaxID=42068 RepID=L0PAT8_PNEJI|nr:signal peptidase I [Pneumocystis jirovecii RU7]KTW31013.1 signal peptidase I [Pneumocystis jirovecii RU7]CCJ29506.1 unnamed protein product [Pneumocystis jirovecii]